MKSRRFGLFSGSSKGSPLRNAPLMSQGSAGSRRCAAVCHTMRCATLSAVGDSVSFCSLSLSRSPRIVRRAFTFQVRPEPFFFSSPSSCWFSGFFLSTQKYCIVCPWHLDASMRGTQRKALRSIHWLHSFFFAIVTCSAYFFRSSFVRSIEPGSAASTSCRSIPSITLAPSSSAMISSMERRARGPRIQISSSGSRCVSGTSCRCSSSSSLHHAMRSLFSSFAKKLM